MKKTFLLGLVLYSLFACKKDNEPEPKPILDTNATVKFQDHVQPIFNTHCNGGYCHGGGADGKYYTSHAEILKVDSDTILGAINRRPGFEPMPKSQPKLRQGEIDTITTWVNEGRKNN